MSAFVSYSQNLEDVMLWRALRDASEGFYIDVGANDPVSDSVTLAFYERGWRGINIEPLSYHYEALCAQRPRDINLNLAVGSSEGDIEFWEFNDAHGWSTANAEVAARHQALGHRSSHRRVPLRTLAAVCAEHAPEDIHFLKIDVEGFEREVLLGADFTRFRPWILVIEATEPNSMTDASAQWESLVVAQGYELVYTDGINRFYLAREHAALKARFSHPPNFFDFYQRYIEVALSAQLTQLRVEAQQREAEGQSGRRRVFVDVSGLMVADFATGINRTMQRLIGHWLQLDAPDFELVLVRCHGEGCDYQRDTDFEQVLQRRGTLFAEPLPLPKVGDLFLIVTPEASLSNTRHDYFHGLMRRGVKVCALVLDFLPVFRDQQVPAVLVDHWHRYTRLLFEFDGVLCISRKVAQDFRTLVDINHVQLKPGFLLGWSHLGADFVQPGESVVVSASEREALVALEGRPCFLVVSSIAPHKGQAQTLAAFEQLWAQGSDASLVLLGGYLWMMEDLVARIESHPELGRRLFWFRGGSDGLLQALFERAICLLSPSEDEGFGLPVVEASRQGVPLLLRDIPVFRELAGDRARYFQGLEPEPLAQAIAQALVDAKAGRLDRFCGPRTLTWAQAARNFWQLLTRQA